MTFDEFGNQFKSVQEDMLRDYPDLNSVCKMLHADFGLDKTPQEHHALHTFLASLEVGGREYGMPNVMALLLAVGRRLGMREAASMFDGLSDIETTET